MVRLATIDDITEMMRVYVIAQQYMMDSGNTTQWAKGYPTEEMIRADIEGGVSHVILGEDGKIHGVFFFNIMEDPTYGVVYDGAWHYDLPYGVIHRIASDGEVRDILGKALDFASSKTDYIRIDTHENNHTMQHVLAKHGFEKCGIIHLLNGNPRIAFDRKNR